MARRYWIKIDGRKLFAKTKPARASMQRLARELGKIVAVGYDDVPARTPRKFARNPDPGTYLPVWNAQRTAAGERKAYLDATKARRLAMSMKRRGVPVDGSPKTARWVLLARNRREQYTLYRPSKAKAQALQRQFEAAGYSTSLNPV